MWRFSSEGCIQISHIKCTSAFILYITSVTLIYLRHSRPNNKRVQIFLEARGVHYYPLEEVLLYFFHLSNDANSVVIAKSLQVSLTTLMSGNARVTYKLSEFALRIFI